MSISIDTVMGEGGPELTTLAMVECGSLVVEQKVKQGSCDWSVPEVFRSDLYRYFDTLANGCERYVCMGDMPFVHTHYTYYV